MNSFFRRLPLPFKLMLIGLIPLIFLIYLTAGLYLEKDQKLNVLGNYIENIHVSVNLSRLIDNLQQERQYSYDYVLKKNHRNEMLLQRPKVDSIIRLIETAKDSTLKGFPKYSFLKNLQDTRNGIDSNKVSANTVMHYYSSSIFRLNTLNGVLPGADVLTRPVYNDMISQKLISEMITYRGIINANVYNLLDTRQYMLETLMGTFPSYEVLKSYEEEFAHKATPDVTSAYNQIRNGSLKPSSDYLEKIFKTFKVDSTYTSRQWSELSAKGLNDLRDLQMNLLRNVENGIIVTYEKEKQAKTQTLVSLILALAIVMGLVVYSIFVINTMLHEIKNAALKIARGESGIDLKNMPVDVMGNVALSISKIDRNYKELAQAAKLIGEGDFETILQPRSENDHLVNALQQMKENLQKSAHETEASREQFRQLADFVPQMVWTAEPNGRLDYFNKQWYEFTGFPVVYGDQSWIPILHPDDVKHCVDAWYNSVHSGNPYEIEYRFKDRKNDTYKWFLGRAVPVRNAEGKIVKWFGTCTDIHERKTMSENLKLLVKERTEELERSNDDLQQFAHVASHDLKEPLRKIRIFGSKLKEEFEEEIPEKAKIYIDKIQLSAERMSAMIEGVLNYSMATHTEENYEQVDIGRVIREILTDLELVVQQRKAIVEFGELPKVNGIGFLIYQLFYNLLNNALKFSKEGQKNLITIVAKKYTGAELNGIANLSYDKDYHVIQIKDNGIGFNPENAERMFQIFARLNNKDKYEGTGLGLALCRKIVLRHHGAIWAEGEEEKGAEISVALPA